MNQDIAEGKWKEIKGQAKEWWRKLTDDELEQAHGNAEQIVGLLQQKYGYTRERTADEIEKRTLGKVKIKIFWSESLGKTSDLPDLVSSGGIDMYILVPGYYPARFPLAQHA